MGLTFTNWGADFQGENKPKQEKEKHNSNYLPKHFLRQTHNSFKSSTNFNSIFCTILKASFKYVVNKKKISKY